MGRKTYKKVKNVWLQYACNLCGSQANLSRKLNTSPQNISNWIYSGKSIPLPVCKKIEKITQGKVTCDNLTLDMKDLEKKRVKTSSKARKS